MRARYGGPQRVREGVVGHHLQGVGSRLRVGEGPLHPDLGVGQFDFGRVEAHQPARGHVLAVVGRCVHTPVELGRLLRVEQSPHRPDDPAGEHVGVEG